MGAAIIEGVMVMVYLDWNPDDEHSGDVQVDRAYDLSSILLSYNGLTVRLDGHQAFVIMQGLAEVLNYELLERAPGEEDDA